MSSRLTWSPQWIPGQEGLCMKTLLQTNASIYLKKKISEVERFTLAQGFCSFLLCLAVFIIVGLMGRMRSCPGVAEQSFSLLIGQEAEKDKKEGPRQDTLQRHAPCGTPIKTYLAWSQHLPIFHQILSPPIYQSIDKVLAPWFSHFRTLAASGTKPLIQEFLWGDGDS